MTDQHLIGKTVYWVGVGYIMKLIKFIKQCLCNHDWIARIKQGKQKWQPDTHWRVVAAKCYCSKCGKTRPMDKEEAQLLMEASE